MRLFVRLLTRLCFVPYLLLALVLSHCATKHQPTAFPFYFPTGPGTEFTSEQAEERATLQAKEVPTLLEKRRILDLNWLELKTLKPTSKRAQIILAENQKLQDKSLDQLQQDLLKLQLQSKLQPQSTDRPVPPFQNAALKRAFSQAQQLWNKELNAAALKRVGDILNLEAWNNATSAEKLRVLNLRFRITTETGDPKLLTAAYLDLKAQAKCAPETAQAALLLSLVVFQSGDGVKAAEILRGQCLAEDSVGAQIKRAYWLARFSDSVGTASPDDYGQALRARIPGYYAFLAQARLRKMLEIPPVMKAGQTAESTNAEMVMLDSPFMVPGDVAEWLRAAEASLAVHLYRDAQIYLEAAALKLKAHVNESTLPPLLHTAALYQAAGNHLEAMKIYSSVFSHFSSEDSKPLLDMGRPLFSRMFPIPFHSQVEWLARLWKVDADFIYAIMRQESAFNPVAISPTNARGLMQLEPPTAKFITQKWKNQALFTEQSLFSAEENLKLAVYYVRQLQDMLPNMVLVAAAYNAGYARVLTWSRKFGNYPLDVFVEMIPYEETRTYVKLVLRNYVYYKSLRAGAPIDGSFLSSGAPVGAPLSVGSFPGRSSADRMP